MPPGEERVVDVLLLVRLGARQAHGARVQDDHEVTHIDVGRVVGLVLAAQDQRDARREAAERIARRIDHEPLALCLAGFFGQPGALLCRVHHNGTRQGERERIF